MTKEVSGIDILEEILDRLDLLEKKIDIIDQNVKNITNIIKTSRSISTVSAPMQDKMPHKQATAEAIEKPSSSDKGFKNFVFQPTDAAKIKQESPLVQRNGPTTNYIVVTGKMVANIDNKLTPLSGVTVKVFDDKDILVKETKTNRSGHWVSHLPPGRYVANFSGELNGKRLIEVNKNFIVPQKLPEGQTELKIV